MTRPLGDKPARKIGVQIPVDDELFEILDRTWKDHPDLFSSRADAARALMWAGMQVLLEATEPKDGSVDLRGPS